MPLKFDSAAVVVRGKFNPYIFSPEWLEQQRIWSHKDVQLALGALSDGINFRSADGSITWSVDPFGLTVRAENAAELVKGVLELLSHTPVSAVGCNFVFSSDKWESDVVPALGGMTLGDFKPQNHIEIAIWTGVFHVDKVRTQMEVAVGEEGITVNFNYHEHTANVDHAIKALEKFHDHRQHAIDAIRDLLKENVDAKST